MTQFILQQGIVVPVADVTSALDTGTNSGSHEEHSSGAMSFASRSGLWYASTTDHAEHVEVIQLVFFAAVQIVATQCHIMSKS